LAEKFYEKLKTTLRRAMALLRYALSKPEYIIDVVILLFWFS